MTDMDAKLDIWKNKLLDLGRRNPLINYRDTRLGNLRIKKPEIFALWDSFVVGEKPLSFPLPEENDDDESAGQAEGKESALPEEDTETGYDGHDGSEEPEVVTDKTPKDLQKALRNIRNKAKTVMEEQGVNVLYLSFGFLRWTEATQSHVTIDSPLVLVPVTLSWESIVSPFVLSLHEDEIVLNPTLVYKMENDFGIKLPEFNSDGALSDYFDSVRDKVSAMRWEVIPEVGLGLLSFLKINMFQDLEKNRASIVANPVVRALGGDASGLRHDVDFINGYDHDKNALPTETFQVVDADSSQQDAILCAKRGLSFVLQGPPGTGKSQTITNIIAESLAAGKKVLFVSEKMAALEVVHKRLKEAGLADFCLILHSHKASKRDTLEQLRAVLDLANQKASLADEAMLKLSQLTRDRDELNDYASSVYTVVEPLHKTIFDVNGYLANLREHRSVSFSLGNVRQTDQIQYTNYINALSRLQNVISKLSVSPGENPWNGSCLKQVSNELREEIPSRLGILVSQLRPVGELYEEIRSALGLALNTSFAEWEKNISFLKASSQVPHVPLTWFVDRDLSSLQADADSASAIQAAYNDRRERVLALHREIEKYDPSIDFTAFEQLRTEDQAREHLNAIKMLIQERDYYAIWNGRTDWDVIMALRSTLTDVVNECGSIVQRISKDFERDIFNIDFDGMYLRFNSDYTSAFKTLKGSYRADKRLMQGLCREVGRKLTDEDIIGVLSELRHFSELREKLTGLDGSLRAAFGSLYGAENTDLAALNDRIRAFEAVRMCRKELAGLLELLVEFYENESRFQENFGTLYEGLDTDWDTARGTIEQLQKYHRDFDSIALANRPFFENLVHREDARSLCEQYAEKLQRIFLAFSPYFNWFLKLFEPDAGLHRLPPAKLEERLSGCLGSLGALEEWIDLREARENCIGLGLGEYIRQAETLELPPEELVPVFQKRFFNLWLDQILPEFPAVARFRRRDHEETIREFARLDRLQLEIARSRIRSQLINTLPSLNHFTSGVDEGSILKRELGKQRRIKPIRVLFREIPNLILALKPCLMMSPLSVSLFLESKAFTFDTVIFDEASQVCTENAIGAIARGKQVIIAGDRHQLPPTNFFGTKVSEGDFDSDDEEEDDSAGFESILDEAALLPECTLLWHYRSRHEHLIAFSNAKIYNNELITFPSNVDRMPDMGVEYFYVPGGSYDRRGRRGNTVEADKVAELVFDHFRRFPDRSLGVIAFGEVQQMAIETAIRKRRRENQQFETFFREDRPEAFFVKSLENVQGDERDTILFSIGYAKDAYGVMRLHFGPLNNAGGERRLNVAMTRAKYNVKLVGSIYPTDIDTGKVNTEGPKLLRSYIEFAMKGSSALLGEAVGAETATHESPFETSVYNFLKSRGYNVATQVGCSGYRIDMAVKHPTYQGRFVLGIECDGASYHSARTARERDRLRQEILENMGWKIYRVWSTDWIKDPVLEGKRLLEAVEKAVSEYVEDIPVPSEPQEAEAKEEPDPTGFIMLANKPDDPYAKENPYGLLPYETADFHRLCPGRSGQLLISDYVNYTVKVEQPIHYDTLCQRIAPILNRGKVTAQVRERVDSALTTLRGRVIRKGDFLYSAGGRSVPARERNGRDIRVISTDELAEVMLLVLKKCTGPTRAGLLDETARAYGFNRRGQNISTALEEAYIQLLSDDRISQSEGKVYLNGSQN